MNHTFDELTNYVSKNRLIDQSTISRLEATVADLQIGLEDNFGKPHDAKIQSFILGTNKLQQLVSVQNETLAALHDELEGIHALRQEVETLRNGMRSQILYTSQIREDMTKVRQVALKDGRGDAGGPPPTEGDDAPDLDYVGSRNSKERENRKSKDRPSKKFRSRRENKNAIGHKLLKHRKLVRKFEVN